MARQVNQPKSKNGNWHYLIAIPILIGCLFLIPSRSFDFDPMAYGGRTQMGSNIAISLHSEKGKLKGRGCHLFSSGKPNDIYLKGSIYSEGKFEFREYLTKDSTFFGQITGHISEDGQFLEGVWTNRDGEDSTTIHLNFSGLNIEETLESNLTLKERAKWWGKSLRDIAEGTIEGVSNK